MMKEWTGFEKSALMESCKQVMSAHDVSTDGKADPSDFLCCIQFCEKYSSEMRIGEALEMMNASKELADVEPGMIKEGDEF
jgi:hypothetical protein